MLPRSSSWRLPHRISPSRNANLPAQGVNCLRNMLPSDIVPTREELEDNTPEDAYVGVPSDDFDTWLPIRIEYDVPPRPAASAASADSSAASAPASSAPKDVGRARTRMKLETPEPKINITEVGSPLSPLATAPLEPAVATCHGPA